MAIDKFTTRALIINHYNSGENDMMLKMYTEDFGVISVLAKSIRKRESKLKGHVRKYHYANVTLIKGKEIYRLVGAAEINSHAYIGAGHIGKQNIIVDIAKLIERLYGGEIKQSSLFNKIFNYINYYYEDQVNEYLIYKMAMYSVLLIELGHMDASVLGVNNIQEYKEMTVESLLLNVSLNKVNISRELHRSIKESML